MNLKPEDLVSDHFKLRELACPCCGRFNMPQYMVDFIERVRRQVGSAMKINSACRCGLHNAKVGGKISSAHLQGLAIDVNCATEGFRSKLIRAAVLNNVRGVGIYLSKGFVHLDLMKRVTDPPLWVEP